jgi:hypothetical protein
MMERGSVTRSNVELRENPQIHDDYQPNHNGFPMLLDLGNTPSSCALNCIARWKIGYTVTTLSISNLAATFLEPIPYIRILTLFLAGTTRSVQYPVGRVPLTRCSGFTAHV